ncbi:hypothetical protein ALP8811_02792 [Aliiroseovarius pelagivivens]|uniref:Uncharacterized protein n=1 Tax=Aliiroseovarius pelagivivens TaxID=1639690 RepID=A0A2R8ASB2_9RHOB|nr:hypothetical protein [Aliiroseovarius pelagivivens]SPF78860.1 hypothetical protein ALP8811_02792 [Aliiroseovarius pelagivivens]
MNDKMGVKPFQDHDPDSEEYRDLRGRLIPVVEEHIGPVKGYSSRQLAASIIANFDNVMVHFWRRDDVSKTLDKLRRSLSEAIGAYNNLPLLVTDQMEWDTGQVDSLNKERFLQKTTHDVLFQHMLPERGATKAYAALKSLAEHSDELISAIEITKRELPEGIPTRNRQTFNEWALIDASVRAAKFNKSINIPDDLDNYGDLTRFLRDVFDVFGIKKTSFRKAYDSWRKYVDGKMENYDLMDI